MKKNIKIAIQGESGSYEEEAAYNFFGNKELDLDYSDFFEEIFEKVETEKVDYGIVPVENTLRGSEGEVFSLLTRSPLFIYGETEIKVDYCLIGSMKSGLKNIKSVFVNPDALRQVRDFIKQKKLITIPSYRPMESLKVLIDNKETSSGSIFNERSAEKFGMKIIEKNVEVEREDFTRYFIIARSENLEDQKFLHKTSIVFQTGHNPGALNEILGEFAKQEINLTRLESQPIAGHPWVYRFFLDFEGNKDDSRVKKAFQKIKEKALFFKFLGSYPVKR